MDTRKLELNQIDELVKDLSNEEVVAFPTDTVYGIGCILSIEAMEKMKWVKGRDEKKPFPLMVYDLNQIEEVAEVTPIAKKVIENFMPGALTIILKKKSHIAKEITNNQETIAIRIPDDEVVLSILKKTKGLLVTSANMSGEAAGCTSDEVLQQLDGRIASVLVGKSKNSMASTIVDCTNNEIKIVRVGPITQEMLMNIV